MSIRRLARIAPWFWVACLVALSAAPLFGQGDGVLLDDFDGGDFDARWWASAGLGTATFTCAPEQPLHEDDLALHLAFSDVADYADCGLDVVAGPLWAGSEGLRFDWWGDRAGLTMLVVVEVEDPTQTHPESEGVTPFVATLEAVGVASAVGIPWTAVALPWDSFVKAEWVGAGGVERLDPARVIVVYFSVAGGQSGDIWLNDLRLMVEGGVGAMALGLPAVNDFLFQLQGLDLEAAGHTAYDLVVMDYSSDGTAAGAYTAAEIDALRHSPGGEKIVLAYLSIGEAEDYRFYWQDGWTAGDPAWLDAENPAWAGNYKVRYWDPAWQGLIYGGPDSYLDHILAAGFDGAYLDLIDAYVYYEERGRAAAAREMADFVIALADYARERQPGFLVFPQNAVELAAHFPDYLATLNGVGQEDVFYGYPDEGDLSPPDFLAAITPYLDWIVGASKTVLVIGYTTDPTQIADHYTRARARGYVPFATVRLLDRLIVNPGFEPD